MKSQKILYTSTDVRNTISDIFRSSKGRRVAVTAFVGEGAEAYLPKLDGLELICWPKAGGTNPNSIRRLMQRGVKVYFADALHMKVYWTEDQGVVITSANLSTNALGSGNLRELGVFLPSQQVNIEQIIQLTRRRRVTEKELLGLDRAHHEYALKNRDARNKSDQNSYKQWYELPSRSKWKFGFWSEFGEFSAAAKKLAKDEYGLSLPYSYISCKKNSYVRYDWILSFKLNRKTPAQVKWMPVDGVPAIARKDKAYDKDFPYQAVQVWPLSRYPAPPFRTDKRFSEALKLALDQFGIEKFENDDVVKPPKNWSILSTKTIRLC